VKEKFFHEYKDYWRDYLQRIVQNFAKENHIDDMRIVDIIPTISQSLHISAHIWGFHHYQTLWA